MLVLYMWGWGWVALCVKLLYFLLCPVEIVFVIISIIYILQVVFSSYPVDNNMFRVGLADAGARCWVCSKLAMKTLEQRQLKFVLVFILLTLRVFSTFFWCLCCWI